MDKSSTFEAHRGHLTGIAYRMLGSWSDAEDVVQEAFIRFAAATGVRDPRGFLTTVTTRLALDALRSARRRREEYVGQWLPEPIVERAGFWEHGAEASARDASLALLVALERLTPLERAVFILHDVFDMGFDEVAATLGRNEAACRQLAVRARGHVREARPRAPVAPEQASRVTEAFFAAASSGDTAALRELLAGDAVLVSDGGRRRFAAINPIRGAERIARFYGGIARKWGTTLWGAPCRVNGMPGYVSVFDGGRVQASALEIDEGRVATIYRMLNPDKLAQAIRIVPDGIGVALGTGRAPSPGQDTPATR